jgi:hypothetical protein
MIADLARNLKQLDADIATLEERRTDTVAAIRREVEYDLSEIRRITGKETGTVAATRDGIRVVETITKKVEWHQDTLASIRAAIVASGDSPSLYMREKYDIPEKMWEQMSPEVQAAIMPARTVKPGKPTIKIEEVEK